MKYAFEGADPSFILPAAALEMGIGYDTRIRSVVEPLHAAPAGEPVHATDIPDGAPRPRVGVLQAETHPLENRKSGGLVPVQRCLRRLGIPIES